MTMPTHWLVAVQNTYFPFKLIRLQTAWARKVPSASCMAAIISVTDLNYPFIWELMVFPSITILFIRDCKPSPFSHFILSQIRAIQASYISLFWECPPIKQVPLLWCIAPENWKRYAGIITHRTQLSLDFRRLSLSCLRIQVFGGKVKYHVGTGSPFCPLAILVCVVTMWVCWTRGRISSTIFDWLPTKK
jgi:hypothetical protein